MIFDAHCDTISVALDKKISICDKKLAFNLNDASLNLPYIQALATFIDPEYSDGFKRANDILDKFYQEYKKYENKMYIIKDSKDINKYLNKVGILLTIENGSAINGKLENIEKFYDRGIRVMSVTWNNDNELGCGALTKKDIGLTELGRKYIKKLNEKNIIVDVSHASEKTFYDIINCSNKSIIATHSCSKSICNHNRNLSDDQIKQIAIRGGIIGVCFYSEFLNANERASSIDIVKHIMHIIDLVGIDYVGLGSDFDGMNKNLYPIDISGTKDMHILVEKLSENGLSDEEITKVMGGNFCNFLKNNI